MFQSEGMLERFLDPSIQGYRKMTPKESKLLLFYNPLVRVEGMCPGASTPVSSNNLGTHSLLHLSDKGPRFRGPGSAI